MVESERKGRFPFVFYKALVNIVNFYTKKLTNRSVSELLNHVIKTRRSKKIKK